jgi:hypothetical protein
MVVRKQWVVGLVNVSTGAGVNYPRIDPPFLLRGFDLLAIFGLAVALPIGLGAGGVALLVPAGVGYLILAICSRLLWRQRLRRQVDRAIDQIHAATTPQANRRVR